MIFYQFNSFNIKGILKQILKQLLNKPLLSLILWQIKIIYAISISGKRFPEKPALQTKELSGNIC